MRALDAYRQAVARALDGLGAFVRIDRGSALFVSDAPSRGDAQSAVCALINAGFCVRMDAKLLYITPDFARVPDALKPAYLDILKASGARAQKLTRTNLAVALRNKDTESARILTDILNELNGQGGEQL